MAQVFGNRILGGIGAPGGGMSEAFGAGVNTALGQRSTRQGMEATAQDMRMRDIDLQWKTEDREEAKRRRAAAEAAAAAARARGVAAIGAIRGGEPFFRLGATTGGGEVAPTRGTPLPFSMGTAAPVGGTITGGGGTATARGTAGQDTLSAPVQNMVRPSFQPAVRQAAGTPTAGYDPVTQSRFAPTGVPTQSRFAPTGAPSQARFYTPGQAVGRPGDFAARATVAGLSVPLPPRSRADVLSGRPVNTVVSANIPQMQQRQEFLRQRIAEETEARQNPSSFLPRIPFDIDAAIAEIAQIDQDIIDAGMTVGTVQSRGVTALEGPGATGQEQPFVARQGRFRPAGVPTVTIQGPNGPVTVPAESPEASPAASAEEAAPLPTAGQTQPGELSFPGAAPMDQAAGAQLGFGPRLGSVASPTEQFLSDVGMAPAGEIDLAALTESYNSPLYDPMFSQLAEQQRTAFAYMAEDAAARGDIGGYIEATAKMREQEMLILTQQLVVGIDEAVNFNSPQRLSAVASMVYGGRDIFIAPKGDGTADVYMDNELLRSGADLNEIATGLRSMVDAEYRSQAAATAAEREQFAYEKQTEADINAQSERELAYGKLLDAVQVDQIRMALEAAGKLPPDPAEYEYREGPNSQVLVIDKRTGEPVAVYSYGVDPETQQTTITQLRLHNG